MHHSLGPSSTGINLTVLLRLKEADVSNLPVHNSDMIEDHIQDTYSNGGQSLVGMDSCIACKPATCLQAGSWTVHAIT